MLFGSEQSIQETIITLGYLGVALIMFLECVFPPIPSELVLPFAGFLVASGEMGFEGVLLASVVGSLAGALVLYALGSWGGDAVVRRFLGRYGRYCRVTEHHYDRVLRVFDRHGEKIIFFGRLVPVIRSLLSIPAGANRMPLARFIFFTLLGLLIWNTVLIVTGHQLGENWEAVTAAFEQYQLVTMVVLVALPVAYIVFRLWKMNTARQQHPQSPS